MSLNMLQSVENFNVQANILENNVRDVDICTQVYYSFIDTIWNFEDNLGTQIMLPSQFVDFRANLMLLELLYNYHGV
jgi:ACT domain-containing protein